MFSGKFDGKKATVDLTSMMDGIYFVKIERGRITYTKKLIVLNNF